MVPIAGSIFDRKPNPISGFSTPLNDMILVHANGKSETLRGDLHGAKSNNVLPTKKTKLRYMKDMPNHNTYRSKQSTDHNLYKPRYEDNFGINSLRDNGHKTRVNSIDLIEDTHGKRISSKLYSANLNISQNNFRKNPRCGSDWFVRRS